MLKPLESTLIFILTYIIFKVIVHPKCILHPFAPHHIVNVSYADIF